MSDEALAAFRLGEGLTILALAERLQWAPTRAMKALKALVAGGKLFEEREPSPRSSAGVRFVYWLADGWRSIETMPIGRTVLAKTVTGRERSARRQPYAEVRTIRRRPGEPFIRCWSMGGKTRGSISAVAWREIVKK